MASRIAETMATGNEQLTSRMEIQTLSEIRTIDSKLRGSKSPQVKRQGGFTASHGFLKHQASPSHVKS